MIFILQFYSIAVYVIALGLLLPAVFRVFTGNVLRLDLIKMSLWFFALCMLNSLYVRYTNGVATLFTYNGGPGWPFASTLVTTSYLITLVSTFNTEKALDRGRNS